MRAEHLCCSDPRENREIIEQVIQLAETWEEDRRNVQLDLFNSREKYPSFKRLHDYVYSLSNEQLDAVYCAYELGGGLDGYAPPKFIAPGEDDDDNNEVHRFKNMKEWIDWVVSDYRESKKTKRYG